MVWCRNLCQALRDNVHSTVRCSLNPAVARLIFRHGSPANFVNAYGPAESRLLGAVREITQAAECYIAMSIGHADPRSTTSIICSHGQVAEVGPEGELWDGRDGLASGCHGEPGRPRERFVEAPVLRQAVERPFCTGDRAPTPIGPSTSRVARGPTGGGERLPRGIR